MLEEPLRLNTSMFVSLPTYTDLAVASPSTRTGGLAEWYCTKEEVLAVPGQVIQTVHYCVPGGLKIARSNLDNVVC